MAVDLFMKIGTLKGESVDKKHAGEIDVLAWSWGASQSGTTHVGGGGGSGKVNVQDMSFTHYIDATSPELFLAVCAGTHYDKATLTVRKAGDKPLEYLIIEMEEVIITSLSTGGSGGEDRLTENVSLNFASFKVSYTPQKPDGSGDKTKEMTWNIAENTK